jgi:hypothetical protein
MRNAAEKSFWTFVDHLPDLGIGNAEPTHRRCGASPYRRSMPNKMSFNDGALAAIIIAQRVTILLLALILWRVCFWNKPADRLFLRSQPRLGFTGISVPNRPGSLAAIAAKVAGDHHRVSRPRALCTGSALASR